MATALSTYAAQAKETALQTMESVPSTVAIQIFTLVGPGLAAGLAGMLLAFRIAKVPRVTTGSVLLASLLISAAVIGSVFLVKPIETPPAA